MGQSSLFTRQINSCPPGYQYYTCGLQGFEGCCSTNACDNGSCAEENQPPTSLDQTATTTARSSTSTSLSQEHTVTVTMPAISSSSSSSPPLSSISSSPSTASFTASLVNDTNEVTSTTAVVSTTTPTSDISKENTPTTSSSHKSAIIGGSVGGVLGALALFLAIFLWCRKRKASSKLSPSNEKGAHKRTFSAYQENSDYDLSNTWSQPSENYYHRPHIQFGHVDRTRSPALSELDSSPIRHSFRPSPSFHSDTIFELDSVNNNRRSTRVSDPPLTPAFTSMSSRETRRDNTNTNTNTSLGHTAWRSSETDLSNISSDRGGGIRLARSTGELSVKSDQHLA